MCHESLIDTIQTPCRSVSAICRATRNSCSVSPPNIAPSKHPSFFSILHIWHQQLYLTISFTAWETTDSTRNLMDEVNNSCSKSCWHQPWKNSSHKYSQAIEHYWPVGMYQADCWSSACWNTCKYDVLQLQLLTADGSGSMHTQVLRTAIYRSLPFTKDQQKINTAHK